MFTPSLTRRVAHHSIVVGLCLVAAGAAQAVSVTVSDINATDWTRVAVSTSGTPTYNATAPSSGGNSGSFWSFTLTGPVVPVGAASQVREAFLFNAATYDPNVLGALGSASIGFDTRTFSSAVLGGAGGFATATLQQGGQIFSATTSGFQEIRLGDWASFSFTSLNASDWVRFGSTETPDFSAAGAAMTFGFRISIGGICPIGSPSNCADPNVSSGLDNFRFDLQPAAAVTPVPEPGTWALMLAGLGVTAWTARRRRPAQS